MLRGPSPRRLAMSEFSEGLEWDPVDIVRERLNHNQNALIVFTGETGSGKSLSAIEFARLIDPKFTVDQIVFTTRDFLRMMKVLDKRRVLLFDEAGVDLDARRSQTKKNVFFSNILKTFRYLQIPTIFTLPNLAMLDKNARRLFHIWVKTREIDYARGICWTSYYKISADDDWNDRVTRALMRIQNPDTKEKRKITRVGFKKPPADLTKAYEAKKDLYVKQMLKEMEKELDEQKEGKVKKIPKGDVSPIPPMTNPGPFRKKAQV